MAYISSKGGRFFRQGGSTAAFAALAGASQFRQSRTLARVIGENISRKGAIVPPNRTVRDMTGCASTKMVAVMIGQEARLQKHLFKGMVGDDGLEPPTFSV